MAKSWAALPVVLVSGYSAPRAMTSDVRFEELPPWQTIPPARGPSKPKSPANLRAVSFSISVRAGET